MAKPKKDAAKSAKTTTVAPSEEGSGLLPIREFTPEEITITPELSDLRQRSGQDYEDEVLNLAAAIFEEKQIHPGLVRETPDGFLLVAGQRRLEAITLLRTKEGQLALGLDDEEAATVASQFKFRAEIRELTDDEAFRLAMLENVQRRRFTPIELARDIKTIRERFKLEGGSAGTKDVADFLKVSTATVTQHERLLSAPAEMQEQIQKGELRMSAALDLLAVPEGKREEVQTVALEKAKKEHDKKEAAKEKKAREHNPTPKVPVYKPGQHKPNVPKVEQKHVRAATKEVEGASTGLKAPKMAELKDLAETWCGPVYQPVMVKFAEGLLEWTAGKLSDKKLTALFDDISDKVPAAKVKEPAKPKAAAPKPDAKKKAPPAKKPAAKAPPKKKK